MRTLPLQFSKETQYAADVCIESEASGIIDFLGSVPRPCYAHIIAEGKSDQIISMTLVDPRSTPSWILQGAVFDRVSANISDFRIIQFRDARRFDLSVDFFKNFKSLERLRLETFSSRIPSDLSSLRELRWLEISRPNITSGKFSSPEAYIQPSISDFAITKFESKPFFGLRELDSLVLFGLTAPEIPEHIFSGLSTLRVLAIENWSSLTVIQVGTYSHTPSLRRLWLKTLPLLDELPAALFQVLENLASLTILKCGLRNLSPDLLPRRDLNVLNLEQNRLRMLGKSLQNISKLHDINLSRNMLESI